jgi:WD40 repeat protein
MRFLNAPMRVVGQVAFGHDGRRLFAAGTMTPELRNKPGNRGVAIWNLDGGADPAARLFADQLVAGFAVNPASGWLYVGTGFDYNDEDASGYFAVHPATGEPFPLGLRGGNEFLLSVHSSGRWLVGAGYRKSWRDAGGWGRQHLVRWRQSPAKPPAEEWQLPARGRWYTSLVACDPDGSRVITHDLEGGRMVTELVYELTVRDPDTGKASGKVPLPGRTVQQLLFSPDGARFVVRAGPSFLVWDAADLAAKPVKVPSGRWGNWNDLAFHPSGRYLAGASNDGTVRLYDAATWQIAKTYDWKLGQARCVAFSPDGTLAAAGGIASNVVVWDVDL